MNLKYTFIAIAFLTITTVCGQSTNTTSAAVAYKDATSQMMYQKFDKAVSLFEEAKGLIDKAITEITDDTKEKVTAKAWYYKALIYMDYSQALAMSGDTAKFKSVVTEKYGEETKAAFEKAVTFSRYKSDLETYVKGKADMMFSMGTQAYNMGTKEGYEGAQQAYLGAAEMMKMVGQIDTNAYVNAAICAEKIERYDLAVQSYKVLAENGYKDGMGYYYLAFAYNKLGDDENYKKAIEEGLNKYPTKKELIIESVNYNLKKGNKKEALSALEKAIQADPNNKTVYFAAGSTFQDMMEAEGAELDAKTREEFLAKAGGYYDKALELDPNYKDAAYNKGAMYLNAGIDMDTQKNNLKLGDPNFEVLEKKANEMFTNAISALEVAHKLDPKNKPIVKYLKVLYGKIGNREKQMEMNNKLKEM